MKYCPVPVVAKPKGFIFDSDKARKKQPYCLIAYDVYLPGYHSVLREDMPPSFGLPNHYLSDGSFILETHYVGSLPE